jgi:cytosine/adenosine deaminase-related metal-dependent hydrolase
MALVLEGTVVTMEAGDAPITGGAVYLSDDGLIEAVTRPKDTPPTGYDSAPKVTTGGVIYPGLIDLHSHLMYNSLPLWQQPNRAAPYTSHEQWPRASTYGPDVSLPGRLLGLTAGHALLAYVETKAIVGGTTSIQGNPRGDRPPDGQLVRNIDTEALGTKEDFIKVTTIVATDAQGLVDAAAALSAGKGFIYHLCEGTDPDLLTSEFALVESSDILQARFVGIHGTALGPTQLQTWAGKGGTLVWSPFSNLWLYGATADVAAAKAAGLRLCLGSDWSPSGTKHLLGELKVADLWNKAQPEPVFTDQELCDLVTCNPGDALALSWHLPVGRIRPGNLADVTVLGRKQADPCRNLIAATERDVRLVVVGGRARYGTTALMKSAGATSATPIKVGSLARRIDLGVAGLTWPDVLAALEAVRANPTAAKQQADDAMAGWDGDPDSPSKPFVLLPDMPAGPSDGDVLGGPGQPPGPIDVPPLESLVHDKAWFDVVDTNPFHHGLLSGLRAYYT